MSGGISTRSLDDLVKAIGIRWLLAVRFAPQA
jgi:hypothetical protein